MVRFPDPYSFSLPVVWAGDDAVLCQKNATSPPVSVSGGDNSLMQAGNVPLPLTSVLVEMSVLHASNNVINFAYVSAFQ